MPKSPTMRLVLMLTALFSSSFVFGQKTVTGTVKDNNKTALVGATITVKGTNNASLSSIDGTSMMSLRCIR